MKKIQINKTINWIIQVFFVIVCFALFARYGVKYDTGLGYREVIIVLVGTTLLLPLFLKNQKPFFENNLFVICGILFIASFLLSDTKAYGLAEIFAFFVLINTVFLISQLKNEKLKILTWGLLILTSLVSIYGLYNFTYQPDPRVISNFINPLDPAQGFPNALALFLLIIWPYSAHKMINSKSIFTKLSSILIFGLVISTIYLTYSRGALIAFIVQLIILALLNYKYFTKNKFKWITGIAIGAIIITTILGVRTYNSQEIPDIRKKITFDNHENITSIEERSNFFKNTTNLILQKPVFGYGPQTFRFIYPRKQNLIYSNSDHPHNIFLKYSFEGGLIFSFLLILIFISIVIKIARQKDFQNKKKDFVLIAFLGVATHSMIDYNFNFLLICIVFGITTGILLNISNNKRAQSKSSESFYYGNIFFISLFIISIVLSVIGIHDYFKTDPFSDFETIKRYTREELETHISKYSDSLYPREFWIQLSDYYFMRSEFDKALAMIERQIEYNPHDKYGFLNKGKILYKLKKYDEAEEAFRKAVELDPKNLMAVHYHFLKTLKTTGQVPSAEYLQLTLYPLLDDFVYYTEHNLHYLAQKSEMEYAKCTIDLLEEFNDTSKDWKLVKDNLREYALKYRESNLKENVCD